MSKMIAMVVPQAKAKLQRVERDVPTPGAKQLLLRVHACGVCHSDSLTVEGLMPGIVYPRVPGHEVIGVIDAVGANVEGWQVGDRAGVGWFGGSCGYCVRCRAGDAFACLNVQAATGVTSDGGYATHVLADVSAVAHVPDDLDSVESAPLLCAGVTTFNALRNSGARPGDLVAVLGVGGLGHLAVQYAARQGFFTVAINTRARQGGTDPISRSTRIYRQCRRRSGRSFAKDGWREGDSGNCHECRCHAIGAGWAGAERDDDGDWSSRRVPNRPGGYAVQAFGGERLVFGCRR